MPHQCTGCGRTFPDGSKEMLSGCPDCGGNKFQFRPSGAVDDPPEAEPPDRPGDDGVTGAVDRAASTVREWVGRDEPERSTDTVPPSPGAEREREREQRPSADRSGDHGGEREDRQDGDTQQPSAGDQPDPTPPRDTDDTDDGHEFDPWPETARRPENRGEDPDAASSSDADPAGSEATSPDHRSGPDARRDAAVSRGEPDPEAEDTAQASARSDVLGREELPRTADRPDDTDAARPSETGPAGDTGDGPAQSRPSADPGTGDDAAPDDGDAGADGPDLDQLRAELNDQFESIKIVEPGQYELNLMELYNREEYIISLKEDGRYAIEVPETWRSGPD